MHLLLKSAKKNIFEWTFNQKNNFKMALDLVDVYEYHSPQNSTINPNFHFL